MSARPFLELPLFAYSAARTAAYTAEFGLLNRLAQLVPGSKRGDPPQLDAGVADQLREEVLGLLRADAHAIAEGIYPPSVLLPESPREHLLRLPRLIWDGVSIQLRRNRGRTTEFSEEARAHLESVPRYYRRNFHFQTDGYLSAQSAELYEHQVEMLFSGTADAMRRLILKPLRDRFGEGDGQGLRFLELAAGAGTTTRFVRLAFPKAKIVVTDLSEPYLKLARERLRAFEHLDFMQADAAALPFQDASFDAVFSVFLFHELPLDARRAVLAESRRVLKPGGFHGLVDSIQAHDHPPFAPLLERFPVDFHEPFYRDYAARPIEELVQAAGLPRPTVERGFFSKVVY